MHPFQLVEINQNTKHLLRCIQWFTFGLGLMVSLTHLSLGPLYESLNGEEELAKHEWEESEEEGDTTIPLEYDEAQLNGAVQPNDCSCFPRDRLPQTK
jgi:hypothetical protein